MALEARTKGGTRLVVACLLYREYVGVPSKRDMRGYVGVQGLGFRVLSLRHQKEPFPGRFSGELLHNQCLVGSC